MTYLPLGGIPAIGLPHGTHLHHYEATLGPNTIDSGIKVAIQEGHYLTRRHDVLKGTWVRRITKFCAITHEESYLKV